MNFHVLTLFPEQIEHCFLNSITGRAVKEGLLSLDTVQIRDFSLDKRHRVDDYAYGPGAGMLMQPQPVDDAIASTFSKIGSGKKRLIYLSPAGKTFDQAKAYELSAFEDLVFLCGHYEGLDQRILDKYQEDLECLSIGDYVLTGGELGALVIMDAVSRLVPGVLGNDFSANEESHTGLLLEYPQFTRPEVWQNRSVPQVLLSGNEKNIRNWRKEEAERVTKEMRPDLYEAYCNQQELLRIFEKDKLLFADLRNVILRGTGRLLYRSEDEIILQDKYSKIYYHALLNDFYAESLTPSESQRGLIGLDRLCAFLNVRGMEFQLVFHQKRAAKLADGLLKIGRELEPSGKAFELCRKSCSLLVYTQHEKFSQRRLRGFSEAAEIKAREIPAGFAFLDDLMPENFTSSDELAFLVGRRINEQVERGFIPYLYCPDQEQADVLIRQLNLCPAKSKVYLLINKTM